MVTSKMYFDNEAEMFSLLEEWKDILGLQDWYIGARICGREDMSDSEWAGEAKVQWVNKCGLISILRKEDIPSDMIMKMPQEQTLIHELLHFKFVGFDEKNREEAIFELFQHQMIETMARALYRTKYHLPREWFIAENSRFSTERSDENV